MNDISHKKNIVVWILLFFLGIFYYYMGKNMLFITNFNKFILISLAVNISLIGLILVIYRKNIL